MWGVQGRELYCLLGALAQSILSVWEPGTTRAMEVRSHT